MRGRPGRQHPAMQRKSGPAMAVGDHGGRWGQKQLYLSLTACCQWAKVPRHAWEEGRHRIHSFILHSSLHPSIHPPIHPLLSIHPPILGAFSEHLLCTDHLLDSNQRIRGPPDTTLVLEGWCEDRTLISNNDM